MLSHVARSARCGQSLLQMYSSSAVGQYAGYATDATDRVLELQSDSDFAMKLKDAADAGSLLICDFTAKWCGPCRTIAPIFSKLSNKYSDPTFVYYKGGRRVESFSGARVDLLEELIRKHTK